MDETLKKESPTLDIVDEALWREDSKKEVQANEEHAQVGMDLDLLSADIGVTEGVVAQVDFFIPEGFFEKIELHPRGNFWRGV